MADPREELIALRRMAELEAKAGIGSSEASSEEPSLISKLRDPKRWPTREQVRQRSMEIGSGFGPASLATGAGSKLIAPAMEQGARWLMKKAVNPTLKHLQTGDAAVAIDALLKHSINPTSKGMEILRRKIDELNKQVSTAIESSDKTITVGKTGESLLDAFKKFQRQANPQSDLEAIRKAWGEFRNHPLFLGKEEIPVQLAQELKQGTQGMLRKKYGQMGTAETEAQKSIAHGLREQIGKAVPEVVPLNKAEQELLTTLSVAERRALLEGNKRQILGISPLAHSPEGFLAYLADKNLLLKALAARGLYSGAKEVPTLGAEFGRGGIMTDIYQQRQ